MSDSSRPTEAEIRAWEKSVTTRKWILGTMLAILVIGVPALIAINAEKQSSQSTVAERDESLQRKTKTEGSMGYASGMQKAEYAGFPYTYKREGERTAATFVPRFLPDDDSIMVGVIRDVIHRAYNDEALGAPALIDWTADSEAVKAIRLDGANSSFIVLPMKEDSGKIHSLLITRIARN